MVNVIAALVIFIGAIAGTGGFVYAADRAGPGDLLYGVDQAVEAVRLDLTTDLEAKAGLLLSFAEERLGEAEELPGKGTKENREDALNRYGETISLLARTLGTAEGVDEAAVAALLDETFSAHEDQLGRILQYTDGDGDTEDDEPERDDPDRCAGVDPHPVGQGLAASYAVPYMEVMSWFCEEGYGFGEIMLALETSTKTEVLPEELLALKEELGGWGQVWQELDLIGKPDDAGPPDNVPVGPPDDAPAGPLDDAPIGPPDDVPVGPPDDAPAGPPDDVPAGPPEDAPAGPPDDAPIGPPDDVPVGPPDDAPAGPPDDAPAGPPEDAPAESPDDTQAGPPDDVPAEPPEDTPAGPSDDAPAGPPDDAPTGPPAGAGGGRP